MGDESDGLRWSVRRRLEFIDARLFWSGQFNRTDLCAAFGTSVAQASMDVARYEALAPSNLTYDRSAKVYRRAPGYEPALIGPSVESQLSQFAGVEGGWPTPGATWSGATTPVEVVALDRPGIEPIALLRILDALRDGAMVEVAPAPAPVAAPAGRASRIAPHGLFRAADRWHVRAWSPDAGEFLDVDIHGASAAGAEGRPEVDPSLDFEWVHRIDLVIAPNPDLTDERRAVVAARHAMVGGRLVRPCRLSLIPYLVAAHDLDVEHGILSPERQPLVLLNAAEVAQTQAAVRQMARQELARRRNGPAPKS